MFWLLDLAFRYAHTLCYRWFMQAKETVRSLLDTLPDDCSLDDVLYHLYVIHMIEIGIEDSDAGRVIPHEVVVEEMRRKWQLGEA